MDRFLSRRFYFPKTISAFLNQGNFSFHSGTNCPDSTPMNNIQESRGKEGEHIVNLI